MRALDNVALTSGANVELLRSVININNRQRLLPVYALRERFGAGMDGLRVGVLGLAFKPDTDDVREAPSLDMINALCDDGAIVSAYDPVAMDMARPHLPATVRLVDNVLEAANQAQAIVLVTEWSEFVEANWQDIARCMNPPRFVFDGRNALDGAKMQRLGFQYVGVGRNGNGPGTAQTM